jgi:hypothetical protein
MGFQSLETYNAMNWRKSLLIASVAGSDGAFVTRSLPFIFSSAATFESRLPSTYHSLNSPACSCVLDHVARIIVNANDGIIVIGCDAARS